MVHYDSSDGTVATTANDRAIPVAAMVESIIGCKWSLGILGLLAARGHRPSALLRASPGLSAKVMNERLQKMMRFGIVNRTVFGEKPPVEVEYMLTPFGRRFMRIIEEVYRLQESVDRESLSESDKIEANEPSRSLNGP
jgi:DNA-binding HxlR family transcriptional regulator